MFKFLANMKISRKLVAVFLITSVIAMGVNLFIYINLNTAMDKINQVFSSNISLNELSNNLNEIHQGLTGYLETKGTDDLQLYYSSSQSMNLMLKELNDTVTDNSVKLAERDIFTEEFGEPPVLMLDDVLSELDARRQAFVLNRIGGGQTLITCCDDELLARRTGGKILTVRKGTIR